MFGAPARRVPPRPASNDAPIPRASAPLPNSSPAPSRLRATLALLLLALAVLFAQPAAKLLGLAPKPEASGTAEASPSGKASPSKPKVRPEAKRAGEA